MYFSVCFIWKNGLFPIFFFEGGKGGSRSTPGFYLMKYIQLFTYIQTIHTFFSVYSTVGFTKFLFYLLGSCLVSF